MSTIIGRMAESKKSHLRPRRIVGFSLTPELAAKVKAEAGRRDISLKTLFDELWALYEKQPKRDKS
jgi:hypothetical protein